MLFITGNPITFQTDLEIDKLHTRSENQLYIPTANRTSVQKEITSSDIKIDNSLPRNTLNPKNDRKQFKNDLYRYILNSSFYPVQEFLEYSRDNVMNRSIVICIVLLQCYAQYFILETVVLTVVYLYCIVRFVLFCLCVICFFIFDKFHVRLLYDRICGPKK